MDELQNAYSEQHLRELARIIESGPAVALIWRGAPGRPVAFVTPNVRDLCGYEAGDFTSGNIAFQQIVHPDDRDMVWSGVQTALQRDEPFVASYRIVTAGGKTRWIREQSRRVRDAAGDGGFVLQGLVMDVTDFITARQEGEKSKERIQLLADILEHSSQPFGVGLPDGRFGAFNQAFRRLTGYSENELNRMDWNDLTPAEWREREQNSLEDLVRTGIPVRYEKEYFRKDGTRVPIELLVHVLRNDAGRPIFYYAFVTDLTDRKAADAEQEKLRRQLLQSQKMESIGQLVGGIAHDFNNMLAVILGNAELLSMKKGVGDSDYHEIREIIDAAKRSRDMTLQLLTFARRGKLDARLIDPAETVRAVAGILTRSLPKSIQIQTDVIPGCLILGDATQIYQALINVCNNAADAMPEGGTLAIEIGPAPDMPESCHVCGKAFRGRYCRIRVRDTGIGMPAEMLPKIVEPFYTTKGVGKGTGLGLSVTHGIVQNHDGHLHIFSEQGQGTCVDFLLPLASPHHGDAPETAPRAETFPSGVGAILIVDDEEAVLSATARILESAGYSPLRAVSGPDAVALFHERHPQIRAVILDLMMPGMDGEQVYHELKKIDPDVKVILSSGYSINGQAGGLMNQGVRAFIQKPFTTAMLCRTLHEVLKPDAQ